MRRPLYNKNIKIQNRSHFYNMRSVFKPWVTYFCKIFEKVRKYSLKTPEIKKKIRKSAFKHPKKKKNKKKKAQMPKTYETLSLS